VSTHHVDTTIIVKRKQNSARSSYIIVRSSRLLLSFFNDYYTHYKSKQMKKIEAIIRTSKFEDVKEALAEKHVNFFTFYEAKGYGHQKGKATVYRGAVYDVGYIGRMKIEIILSEHFVDAAIEAIRSAAHSGENGDGLIMVTALESVINIRSGAKDSEAINS